MKKILSFALIFALAIALPFAFVGCKKKDAGVVGTWTYGGTRYEGISDEMRAMIEANGEDEGFSVVIEIKADGTGTYTATYTEDGQTESETANFTWKQDGDKYIMTITEDGETSDETFYYVNGELRSKSYDLGEEAGEGAIAYQYYVRK